MHKFRIDPETGEISIDGFKLKGLRSYTFKQWESDPRGTLTLTLCVNTATDEFVEKLDAGLAQHNSKQAE